MKLKQRFMFLSALILLLLSVSVVNAAPVVYPYEGDYYIIPRSSNRFALGINTDGGGGIPEQTPVCLYEKNDSSAQVFNLKRAGGGWYVITHKNSGLCLSVQNSANNSVLYLSSNNNSDNCYWRFAYSANDYIIQNKLGNHRVIELQNNQPYSGAVIHLRQYNEGNSARWKLIPAP